MKMNYTSVCFFCGVIYPSNKSTSRYCYPGHNSMYNANGTKINNLILTPKGIYVDYSDILVWIWVKDLEEPVQFSWSKGYTQHQLFQELYDGPLPQGSELILVGQFLIKKLEGWDGHHLYHVKPIYSLTKSEKAKCIIINGAFDKE